jgi:hypothetical protein
MGGFFLRLLATLVFAVIATASWAQTQLQCPSAYADGCSAAPTESSTAIADGIQVLVPNFFTGYAQQNGQTYVSAPPWNVAGVNYAVGINASYAGNLMDPATAPLPTGCAFHGGTSPYVACANVNNLTISGYDFGHSVAGSVQLYIAEGVTGTLTISNNKFFNGPTLDSDFFGVDITDNNSANVVMNYNYFDGNGPGIPNGLLVAMVLDQSTGSLTFQYNALLNITSKGLSYGSDSNVNVSYNYGEGLNFGSPAHSEFVSGGPASSISTMSNEEIGYNTFIVDNNNAGGTANIYVSNGVDGGTVLTANVDHNVDVANYDYNPPAGNPNFSEITSSYLIEAAHQDFGDLSFLDNYFDPNGSFGCIYPFFTATTATFSGNVDMIDASTVGSSGACDFSDGILPTSAGGMPDSGGSAVPEPPTWAMVLMASLVFGYSMSRGGGHRGPCISSTGLSGAGTGSRWSSKKASQPARSSARTDD